MKVGLSSHDHRFNISNFYFPFVHSDEKKNFALKRITKLSRSIISKLVVHLIYIQFSFLFRVIIKQFPYSLRWFEENKNTLRDSIHSKLVVFISCSFVGCFLLMHFLSFSLTGPERIEETNRWRRFLLSSSRPMSTCNFFIRLIRRN